MKNTFEFALLLLASLFAVCVNLEEKRWVWQDKKQNAQLARYEVVDDEGPFRPGGFYQRPHYTPSNERPGGLYGSKPTGGYGLIKPTPGTGGFGLVQPTPSGGYGLVHPPFKPAGVITGPEPSWSQPRPLKDYDKCKCTQKFNCPSPGVSYGHCDVGKSYCCFTTKLENPGEPFPAQPVYSPENGVLVGPGGPVDYPKPVYNRPGGAGGGYGVTNGVLTGPRPGYQQGGIGVPYSPGIRPRSTND